MKTPQPATFRISYPKLISVGLSASMKAEGHLSIPQGLIVSTAQQSALISHHCKHQMCAQQEARQMRKYKNSILASDADYSGRCLPQERPRLLGHPWGPTRGGTVWDLCSWAHTSAVDSSHPSTQHFAELLLEASWSYSWAPNSAWKHLFFLSGQIPLQGSLAVQVSLPELSLTSFGTWVKSVIDSPTVPQPACVPSTVDEHFVFSFNNPLSVYVLPTPWGLVRCKHSANTILMDAWMHYLEMTVKSDVETCNGEEAERWNTF